MNEEKRRKKNKKKTGTQRDNQNKQCDETKNTHHNWEMWYKNKVILKIRYSSCHRLLWVQLKYAIYVLLLDRFMRITDSLMKYNISCSFYKWKKKSTYAKIQFTLWMAVQTTYLIWRKKTSNFLVNFFQFISLSTASDNEVDSPRFLKKNKTNICHSCMCLLAITFKSDTIETRS